MPEQGEFRSLTYQRKRIAQRIKNLQNPQPLMAHIAKQIEAMSRRAIDVSRSPAGQQFAAVQPRRSGNTGPPLFDTGESYGLIRCFASTRNGLVLMAPRKLRYHMKAGPHRPKRNAFPFEIGADGKPHPIPKLDKMIRAAARAHFIDLKAERDLPIAAE